MPPPAMPALFEGGIDGVMAFDFIDGVIVPEP
jgi:hypothetical protein